MPPSELPALRLVEIPDAAPPYDCETHGTGCPAARAAARADPHVDGPRVDSPRVDGPYVDGPRVDGPRVDSSRVDSPRVDSPRVDGPRADGPYVDGPRVDGPRVDGPRVDGPRVDSSRVDSSRVDGPGTATGSRAGRAQPGARPAVPGTTAAWPRHFAQVMVEILAGVRPPGQIAPWTTDRVRAQIRQLSPLLVSDRRPRIQRIVVSRPVVSVMEMTVVVNVGSRSRALALRFDYVRARPAAPGLPARPARWVCTTMEAG